MIEVMSRHDDARVLPAVQTARNLSGRRRHAAGSTMVGSKLLKMWAIERLRVDN
jgi:hypothetical protein